LAHLVAALLVVVVLGCSGTADTGAADTGAAPAADTGEAAAGASVGAVPEAGAQAGVGGETDAGAARPSCGSSRYVEEIAVQQWADGRFRVSLWPTPEARRPGNGDEVTAGMWQAVRRCLRGFAGFDGEVGASLEDQLHCHVYLALVPALDGEGRYATGETFDLENWRPTPGRRRWVSTRCGNTLGADPASPPVRTYRPDGVQPEHTFSGEHA
jgi:hypothetical protein